MTAPILQVTDLHVTYAGDGSTVRAVKGISFDLMAGQVLGVVGESGSGKSTAGQAALGALPPFARREGRVLYRDFDLLSCGEADLRRIWGRRLAYVPQDPSGALNPILTIGRQLSETISRHMGWSPTRSWKHAVACLTAVHLPDAEGIARRYPHQLSGGQRQRVTIALALSCEPEVVVLDEPTTGLDVTTQAHILDLLNEIRRRDNVSMLYITHDLGVIARIASDVAVMYAGEIVERGPIDRVLADPRHPYTAALLDCLPGNHPRGTRLPAIDGGLPNPSAISTQCQFVSRCRLAGESCTMHVPPAVKVAHRHYSCCFFPQLVQRISGTQAPSLRMVARAQTASLLTVKDISHRYDADDLFSFRRAKRNAAALQDINLVLEKGQTLAIVGESGSGKTTLGRCIIGLLRPTEGEICLSGIRLPRRLGAWSRGLRKRIQVVFQNPDRTLNPKHTVLFALDRAIRMAGISDPTVRRARAVALLEAVRLDERYLSRYPRELSGGERQRVAIARALACEPEIVVCDEPTSALDISVQASVLNLLEDLKRSHGHSYVFISHDLGVVRHIADRVVVLFRGRICQEGTVEQVFDGPHHPYTARLLAATAALSGTMRADEQSTLGQKAPVSEVAKGCVFSAHCERKLDGLCEAHVPSLVYDGEGHGIACHLFRADFSGEAAAPAGERQSKLMKGGGSYAHSL